MGGRGPTAVQEEAPRFTNRLSQEQLRQFQRDGFLHLRDVVPGPLRSRALAAIKQRLGKGIKSEEAAAFKLVRGGLGYWPDLAHTDVILNMLYRTPLIAYVSHLIGTPQRCNSGQIAIRFPGHSCLHTEEHSDISNLIQLGRGFNELTGIDKVSEHVDKHPYETDYIVPAKWKEFWHIDGVPNKMNSLLFPQGTIMQFTLLVGVLLSDLDGPLAGNLTVFPGSHLAIQSHINQNNVDPRDVLLTSSSADSAVPPISLPKPPQQLVGKAGDVFLCHYQTAHTVAPNASDQVRYAVYFRLHHAERQPGKYRPAAMKDVWLEYDSIRQLQ